MTPTTLLDLIFTNLTAALNSLTPIKMEKTGWYYKKCSAIDGLTVEYVLNSTEVQLRKKFNVGPKRVLYIKERMEKLLPGSILNLLPLFNPDAAVIPTNAQKEREAEEAARKAEWDAKNKDLAQIIAECGFDDDDDE